MNTPIQRVAAASSLLALLALTLACGAGSDSDAAPEQNYSTRSVRWGDGCGVPFDEVANATFRVGQVPCVELMLEGYYTEGTLEARWFHDQQHLGTGRIEFNSMQALLQRLTEGEAVSQVTFPFDAQLPPSDAYRVVIHRNGREVASYPFRVIR